MTDTVAIVLPPAGTTAGATAGAAASGMVDALRAIPSRFRRVLVGPPGMRAVPGMDQRIAQPSWFPGSACRRYAGGVATVLDDLLPAVIEVHDRPEVVLFLAERFRPVPVILILHTDPQALRGAHDGAARTFLLAQATRAATASAWVRARLLDGVHPAMRHCALLPGWEGEAQARQTADLLDALRLDALQAWSRRLDATI